MLINSASLSAPQTAQEDRACRHMQDLTKSGLPAALLICSWGKANYRYPAGADNKVTTQYLGCQVPQQLTLSLGSLSSSCKMQLVSRPSAFPLFSCYNHEWQRPSVGVQYSSSANNMPHCTC